jgi:hypothetical protein
MVWAALDANTVEKLVIGAVVLLAVGVLLVVRSAMRMVTKVVTIIVLAGLGLALFQSRADLGRCGQSCACTLYGHDVEVPRLPFACDR